MSYKTTIKSNVIAVELDKKEVKITCHNNKSGKTVMAALTQNPSVFGGEIYDIKKGATAKDFKVKYKKKEYAETFYDNIMAIVSDKNVPTTSPESSGMEGIQDKLGSLLQGMGQEQAAPAPAPAGDGDDSNKTLLIVGGAVALVLVIGLAIWAAGR